MAHQRLTSLAHAAVALPAPILGAAATATPPAAATPAWRAVTATPSAPAPAADLTTFATFAPATTASAATAATAPALPPRTFIVIMPTAGAGSVTAALGSRPGGHGLGARPEVGIHLDDADPRHAWADRPGTA